MGYYYYSAFYYIGYSLIIIALIITLASDIYLKTRYSKYRKKEISSKITGAEAAREILKQNHLENIYVVETKGYLSDHYDPKQKVIRLSSDIYNGNSIAAVSVAAHECGHAVQAKEGYALLKFRSFLVPFVGFGTKFGYIAILVGLIFSSNNIAWIGVALLMFMLLFQLVTLPVEFNASQRAKSFLVKQNIINSKEKEDCSSMLRAAAFTYVASLISTILDLLRIVLVIIGNNNDN